MKDHILFTSNIPNKNNRIYPEHTLLKMVEIASQRVQDCTLLVERTILLTASPTVDLGNVVGIVNGIRYENGKVLVNVKSLLGNEDIFDQLDNGLTYITSRGIGNVDENGVVTNFELLSVALTPDPA